MDLKAKQIFNHYKNLIESHTFDEYDILGFLIFMRSYLPKKTYPNICDFCDLIAHRVRDRGTAMVAIENAIKNDYETIADTNEVKNYRGITKEQWKDEWIRLGRNLRIRITKDTVSEIMICIFSLAQFTSYSSSRGKGLIKLFQAKGGTLALVTTEGKAKSVFICFSVYSSYTFLYEFPGGIINDTVKTKRIGTELQLFAGNIRII